MPDPYERRLRLAAAATSPAVARDVVAAGLIDAGLGHLRHQALLMTSELVTNGVVHGESEIELAVRADSGGIDVAVTDFGAARREFAVWEVTGSSREGGGHGLFLVAQFSSRWGTNHRAGARTVWFRLDNSPEPDAAAPRSFGSSTSLRDPVDDVGSSGPGGAASRSLDTVVGAIVGPPDSSEPGEPAAALSEALDRLLLALEAATAAISIDRADGNGPASFAHSTAAATSRPDGRTIQVPLRLSRPWTGELSVSGVHSPYGEPVAALQAEQLSLLIESQRREQVHRDRQGWLLFIAQAGELLARSMSFELTAALLPQLVVPRLGQWCAAHTANEYGELALTAATHVDEDAIATLTTDLERQLPTLTRALYADRPSPLGRPHEGLVLPLTIGQAQVGTLAVGNPPNRAHTTDEVSVLLALSRRAVLAIDNARSHAGRQRIATALQQSLLPPALPSIDGLEVATQYAPAGEGLAVGGDFYDLVPVPDRGWLLAVGDVSGKGVGAAAVTGVVREVLHTLALDYHDPEHTLRRLNAALVGRGGGHFCTLALAFITAAAPHMFDVAIHLAGHDQPVLLRADGATSYVGTGGTALGLLDTIRTPRTMVRLHRGDALVLYTDGVTERRRGNTFYGKHRLRSTISTLSGASAEVLASELRAEVLGFSPIAPRDDIAIVAVRASG